MNFESLKLNVADWLNKSNLSKNIPSFISFGQRRLEDKLRIPAMEYLFPNYPSIVKDINELSVPSDYVELIYLAFTDQLPAPVNETFTAGAGSLNAGTYYYRVTAINAEGETTGSTETSLVLGAQGGVNVNWAKVEGATGYKIYGRSTGNTKLIATVGDVATYLDNGSVTPAAAIPTRNTTGVTRYPNLDRYTSAKHGDFFSAISSTNTGRPEVMARTGDKFYFDRFTDVAYVYQLNYYRRLPALSISNPTNWWTDNAEEALLYACLVSAIPFLGDDPRGPEWKSAYDEALERLVDNANLEKISGQKASYGSINVF